MKASIRTYPHGMTKADQLKVYGVEGKGKLDELKSPFVVIHFMLTGVGAVISIAEVQRMGVSDKDIQKAIHESVEFEVKLEPIPKPH